MSGGALHLLIIIGWGTGFLLLLAMGIVARRWWVERRARHHALHVRLLCSELMQAVARGDERFLITHWTRRDRAAAFEVASQLLSFLRGADRKLLQGIVEANGVLEKPLGRIARLSVRRRIVRVRLLANFGNEVVQNCLHALLRFDPSPAVRLEAAVAILVAGDLPSPWRVLRSVLSPAEALTPNHHLLFRNFALKHPEAMMALATMHSDPRLRQLAIDALGHTADLRAKDVLESLLREEDAGITSAARQSLALWSGNSIAAFQARPSSSPSGLVSLLGEAEAA